MGRRTKRIAITKMKEERKPILQMTPLERRNVRKSYLMREELRNEELKHKKWEEIKKLVESDDLPTEEKKTKENELFKTILKCDEELIKINEELTTIETTEAEERHEEALKNMITIEDDDSIQEIIFINLED